MYSNAAARDYSRGPPVRPSPPLFGHRSLTTGACTAREHRGRAAAGHTAPPDRRAAPHASLPRGAAHGPSPTSVASPIKGAPSPPPLFFPLSSYLAGARSSNLSSPPLIPQPRVSADELDCHRHAIFMLPCHCPPAPHLPSLLDRASPPPSSPPALGLVDTLPVHRSSAAVLGHFLRPTIVGRLR
jgi:hypothetical protein